MVVLVDHIWYYLYDWSTITPCIHWYLTDTMKNEVNDSLEKWSLHLSSIDIISIIPSLVSYRFIPHLTRWGMEYVNIYTMKNEVILSYHIHPFHSSSYEMRNRLISPKERIESIFDSDSESDDDIYFLEKEETSVSHFYILHLLLSIYDQSTS